MLTLWFDLAGSLNVEKIIIVFHSLTGIKTEHVLALFNSSINALKLFRKVIRVGALDNKISKICVAYLPHDLFDLPVLAGLILIAVWDRPCILILPQHVFQNIADCLHLTVNDHDGLDWIRLHIFAILFLDDVHFLHKLSFKHRELIFQFRCGWAISIFGLRLIVAFWFVFEVGFVNLALAEGDFYLIVIILLPLHLLIQFNYVILDLQQYTD